MSDVIWTQERNASLARMWGTMPAPQIADALGVVSKNAVIGQAHRMGLGDGWRAPPLMTKRAIRRRAAKSRKGQRKAPMPGRNTLKPLPSLAEPAPTPPPPKPAPKPAVLSCNLCSWPIGDPRDRRNFRYCDAPAEFGSVYCPDHEKIAYVRVRDRGWE